MRGRYLGLFIAFFFSISIQSCDKSPVDTGAEFQITDSPSDDPQVAGVFVTVSEIQIDGIALPGFKRQTVDLKDLQDGKTKVLGAARLDARTFKNVIMVLDVDNDAAGSVPGCYVLTINGNKVRLSTENKITLPVNKLWKVNSGSTSHMVLDFDIRKSIQQIGDGTSYAFTSADRLAHAVRMVSIEESGTILGNYSDPRADDDKIIVYAYEPGTFNFDTETAPQGPEGLRFLHAISSAEVKLGTTARVYTLAFLEEGKYDLRFAAYQLDAITGKMKYIELLDAETSVGSTVTTFVKVTKEEVSEPSTMILHNWFNKSLLR